ncbi:hypothetical protein [Pseudozobellia sp. WGM2]|uniref:hypothetical protein n=1 Tax=Pseudozobellia sp. WGM2 TaxID=2787625 RepID=UPI001AE03A49|nr:hypothetical protein [Pseudozobellia sp. WGM2]
MKTHSRLSLKTLLKRFTNVFALLMTLHVLGAPVPITEDINNTIELKSYSFNAKKRSAFVISGVSEQIERGLTIIHFNTSLKYEYKTFDTYSSTEACEQAIDVIESLIEKKAFFTILAHDSAANTLLNSSKELKGSGLPLLTGIKGRQAYIMHNFNGDIFESIDDVEVTLTLSIPQNISDSNIFFPKVRYEFEPNNNRYIAHAGGEINGVKSTNSKDALDLNYKNGFRLFELDIIETADKKLVAAHDWKMWARFTDYSGALPPTLAEFKKHKIYGDYHTLDMDGINTWFQNHPDAILVTDKVNDPIAFAEAFVDKTRLIMELFSQMAIEEAAAHGIQTMISQDPLLQIKGDKIDYLAINNIKYVAVSRRIISGKTKLMLRLKEQGIKVYVYNVNFDPGKDEKYVYDNELGLVYGMYADKWVFDEFEASKSSR